MTARYLDSLARTAALLMLTGVAACDDDAEFGVDPEDAEFRTGTGQNGPLFNTNLIFNSDVSQVDTTGAPLHGVKLEAVQVITGQGIVTMGSSALHVDHGTLVGQTNGLTVVGASFVGSVWKFSVDGASLTARLVTVETSLAAGLYDPLNVSQIRLLDPERLVYTFQYIDPIRKKPIKTCQEDPIAGARMVLMGDLDVDYDSGDVTSVQNRIFFGCISGAIGKAVMWGYAPDSPSLPSLSLPAYETATRLVRADYCGDNTPHTAVGKQLTLSDRWGVNSHGGIPFTTEAIWEVGGAARCLNRIRFDGSKLLAPYVCPADKRKIPLCPATEGDVTNLWNQGYGDLWSRIE